MAQFQQDKILVQVLLVQLMDKWPSGYGTGLLNKRSQVQKHRVAEKNASAFHRSKVNLMSIKDSWGLKS